MQLNSQMMYSMQRLRGGLISSTHDYCAEDVFYETMPARRPGVLDFTFSGSLDAQKEYYVQSLRGGLVSSTMDV